MRNLASVSLMFVCIAPDISLVLKIAENPFYLFVRNYLFDMYLHIKVFGATLFNT